MNGYRTQLQLIQLGSSDTRMFQATTMRGVRRNLIVSGIPEHRDLKPKRRNQDQLMIIVHVERSKVRQHDLIDPKDDRNVAEQLRLHAPFRSFASRGANLRTEAQPGSHRRKRKRRSSSPASLLEPAVFPIVSQELHQTYGVLEPKTSHHQNQDSHIEVSSRASSSIIDSPEKPAKTYERRSRHKTREDRYDLQKDKKPDKTKDAKSKHKKKRKGVQKSGAVLMQNFSAGNVETDRLTLKATVPVGLFGKGRASSPIRRKGLPDLSFSEVNFLNHGKGSQKENVRSTAKSKRRQEAKAADTEAEFSRFFASSKDTGRANVGMTEHGSGVKVRRPAEAAEERDHSSLAPVDMPERPFLGFGKCGPGYVSPVMIIVHQIYHIFHMVPEQPVQTPHIRASVAISSEVRWESCGVASKAKYGVEKSRSPFIITRCLPSTLRKHAIIDSSVSEGGVHGCPNKLSVAVEQAGHDSRAVPEQQRNTHETCVRVHSQSQDAGGTDTHLASLLASQNRSEVLGVVLDLLLGKTNAHNTKPGERPKHTEVEDSKGEDDSLLQGFVPNSQVPYQANVIHSRELPCADSNLSLHRELLASAPKVPYSQRTQSSSTNNSRKATRSPNCQPQTPRAETNQLLEPQSSTQHEMLLDRQSRAIRSRPSTSNAWTGYRNIYQGQIDTQNRTIVQGKIHTDIRNNHFKERIQAKGQTTHRADQEPEPGWVNGHLPRIFEEAKQDEPESEHMYPSTHEMATATHMLPNSFEINDEMYPQQQHEIYQLNEAAHQDFVSEPAFNQTSDYATGGYHDEGQAVSHKPEPPAFLGARGTWNLEQEDHVSSWSPNPRSKTQDRMFEFLRPKDKSDVAVEELAPLSGFWKSQRLY
ncbi:MAG: hypothetical protein Q9168_005177 [Polycauliona sp. 1 TL-2023]